MVRLREAYIQANYFLESKDILPSFFCRGGAKSDWLWSEHLDQQYDCNLIAIGSNELACCTVEQLQDRLNDYSYHLLCHGFTKHVVIMGLWPRKSEIFSLRARLFNKLSRHNMYWHSGILFWNWSRKLTFRFDGAVHLTKNAYRRALKFIISPVQYIFPYNSK